MRLAYESWSRAMKYVLSAAVIAAGLASIIASVTTGGGGQTGITIAAADSSAPTLSLGAGQPDGGPNGAVSESGSDQSITLTKKTGVLNLLATASDPESGVQTLQVFVMQEVTTCNVAAGTCTKSGPGLAGAPTYEFSEPKKNPGETTSASRTLVQALDLTQYIAQGAVSPGTTRMTRLDMMAVAKNHLGGSATTHFLYASWSE